MSLPVLPKEFNKLLLGVLLRTILPPRRQQFKLPTSATAVSLPSISAPDVAPVAGPVLVLLTSTAAPQPGSPTPVPNGVVGSLTSPPSTPSVALVSPPPPAMTPVTLRPAILARPPSPTIIAVPVAAGHPTTAGTTTKPLAAAQPESFSNARPVQQQQQSPPPAAAAAAAASSTLVGMFTPCVH